MKTLLDLPAIDLIDPVSQNEDRNSDVNQGGIIYWRVHIRTNY